MTAEVGNGESKEKEKAGALPYFLRNPLCTTAVFIPVLSQAAEIQSVEVDVLPSF